MTPERGVPQCNDVITREGIMWVCGRPRHHPPEASGAIVHQCIGMKHPNDGRTYIINWTEPTEEQQ